MGFAAAGRDDSARRAAIEEAQQVLTELQTGGDFEVLARRFSDDVGTAAKLALPECVADVCNRGVTPPCIVLRADERARHA